MLPKIYSCTKICLNWGFLPDVESGVELGTVQVFVFRLKGQNPGERRSPPAYNLARSNLSRSGEVSTYTRLSPLMAAELVLTNRRLVSWDV
ncbi:hypothetical protein CCYS_12510 [Corynebacterium cystitidis DSM 20524]|uniref:Uncharacterized protein n=1 Tax=Corynebacterium cystitidis DSM 20524 TaxID=1121357 RepID=A0A1H9WFY7_9CORY|nr:hypothetical protein CCYS_12510 [Corynebacterium cystitidis DSM 20524]SES32800.1 hypothetical protein SAMN05661109_02717 [Corynebacterium cystitidis DSM 20524]SNV62313.1 Uncharacterised protein [Corynebacterium cystitidis]